MNYPQIRIKKSFLLNDKVIPLLLPELENQGRLNEAEGNFIDDKVEVYKQIWSKYESIVIPAICKVLDLEFYQNTIDVYIAPFSNSFSDPMVVSTKYDEERFIEVITHELLHRLLTDNSKLPLKSGDKLLPHWARLFGEEHSFVTLVHIPVHAVLKYILIDVLHAPDRLKRDIEKSGRSEEYDKAWKYVQENDYMQIIDRVKNLY